MQAGGCKRQRPRYPASMPNDADPDLNLALPRELADWVKDRWRLLLDRCQSEGVQVVDTAAARTAWRKVLLASDFAFEILHRQPWWLGESAARRLHQAELPIGELAEQLQSTESNEFPVALRRVRQGESLRLIYRDVLGLDDVETILSATTALYDLLLRVAAERAARHIASRHGELRATNGDAQHLVVVAMGKMGGGELNFSSDIDLILAYPEGGESEGARPLDDVEYFARVGRELVRLLDENRPEGRVARVDLRLRPFGKSGRLAFSFAAMEQYYQREGRDWERYAWIKARPVAGAPAQGEELLQMLRPFVYRRYLDYTAFAGLREMKALIDAEVARRDLADNLKLGPGGIREIEFCVQLVQLIRGGRDAELRVPGLLPALAVCAERGWIGVENARRLRQAYLCLRQVENRLQMLGDRQTHAPPDDATMRQRVALALGEADWPSLAASLAAERRVVSEEFAALLMPDGGRAVAVANDADTELWRAARDGVLSAEAMESRGFSPGETTRDVLMAVPRSTAVASMSARSAERLDRLMPQLLAAAIRTSDPAGCITLLAELVQEVARRSSYLALLDEQPDARQRLARLFAESAFLARRVIDQPLLLDDVLDPRIEALPLRQSQVAEEIGRALDTLDERHPEADLERLAELRASLAFRLGLAFRDQRADAVATARRLAALAAACVNAVLTLARSELVRRHGDLPQGRFAVIGYGSLGGAELGFGSDLDLVFVHDQAAAEAESDGPRPLDGVRWLQRLAQRVVHWLGSQHRGGRLYEIDTRLRPDGTKGLLVTSIEGFAAYQRERAWAWEHQALVRARPVAGDPGLMQSFERTRREILALPREPAAVCEQVCAMRSRWRRERDRSDADRVDLKQGVGALLDIEFLLQGMVLMHGGAQPDLLASGNTQELLTAVGRCGVMQAAEIDAVREAHGVLLRRALQCALDMRPRLVPRDAELAGHLDMVRQVAREYDLFADRG